MNKVKERQLEDNVKRQAAESEANFDKIKKEIQEKKAKIESGKKQQEFRKKLEEIKIDTKEIDKKKTDVFKEMDRLVDNAPEKIKVEEAEYTLSKFRSRLAGIGMDALEAMDNALNDEVLSSCRELISEYSQYINGLVSDGALNIGGNDFQKAGKIDKFKKLSVDDLLNDEYVHEEPHKVYKGQKKKKGVLAFFARIFGFDDAGYEDDYDTEYSKVVDFRRFAGEKIVKDKKDFDTGMKDAVEKTQARVENLKKETRNKLRDLDEILNNLYGELDKQLSSMDELKKEVEANREKAEWVTKYIEQVNELLEIK
jgi:hypothetical protein